MSSLPFARSYWVEPGKLLAGCYPGAQDAGEADSKLGGLVQAGVGTVINLMEPDEVSWGGHPFEPYAERIAEIGKESGRAVTCVRLPIRDTSIASADRMGENLAAIDAGIAKGHGVFVHCWGGKGRTGSVVGCYLIQKGSATPDNFVDVIRELRGPDALSGASPENETQIQFVRDYGTS